MEVRSRFKVPWGLIIMVAIIVLGEWMDRPKSLSKADIESIAQMTSTLIVGEGYEATATDGKVEWTGPSGEPEPWDLEGLHAVCLELPQEEWEQYIRDLVQVRVAGAKELAVIDVIKSDYSKVKDCLAVRLCSPGVLDELDDPDEAIARQDLDGTVSVVMYGLEHAVAGVKAARLADWGITRDELFRVAYESTFSNYTEEFSAVEVGDGVTVLAAIAGHGFTATRLMDPARIPGAVGTNGCLFVIPHPTTALLYPVNEGDERLLAAANDLAEAALAIYGEAEGGVSSSLYWFDGADYTVIPYTALMGRAVVKAPDALRQLQ